MKSLSAPTKWKIPNIHSAFFRHEASKKSECGIVDADENEQ